MYASLGRVFDVPRQQKRVTFFVWTKAWEKILTCDNLMKRGITLVDWCFMCRCSGEIVHHLMLHYDIAYALWTCFHCVWSPRSSQEVLVIFCLVGEIGLKRMLLLFGI
jgi:hypothetical protein